MKKDKGNSSITRFQFKSVCYDDIIPLQKNNIIQHKFSSSFLGDTVVDDSKYRPNANVVRSGIDSGGLYQEGVFDFNDGKDNGYTPTLRKLSPDPVEVDTALEFIRESAKNAKSKQDKATLEKQQQELTDKALKGLSALGEIASQDSSEQPSD